MALLKSLFRHLFKYEIHSLQKEIEQKSQQIASTEQSLQSERKARRSAESKHTTLRTQLQEAQQTISSQSSQISSLRSEVALNAQQLTELRNIHTNVVQELESRLRHHQEASNTTITQKTSEITSLQNRLDTKEQECARLADEIAEATMCVVRKDDTIEILMEAKQSLESALQTALAEKISLEEQISSFRDSREQEISNAEVEISRLRSEIEELKRKETSSEIVDALRKELVAKRDEVADLEQNVQDLNEMYSNLKREHAFLQTSLSDVQSEREYLNKRLEQYSTAIMQVRELENAIETLKSEKRALNVALSNAPSPEDLLKRDRTIQKLNAELEELKSQIEKLKKPQPPIIDFPQPPVGPSVSPSTPISPTTPNCQKNVTRRQMSPYRSLLSLSGAPLETIDFPKIENDNQYATSSRMIDEVYDVRSNKTIKAVKILKEWTVEEISKLRIDLTEAVRLNEDYLVCPCCRGKLIIKSRQSNWANEGREIQYFSHALKNIPCALKKAPQYPSVTDGYGDDTLDREFVFQIRTKIQNALTSDISVSKGISDVVTGEFIHSDELPIMKRRLADVTAHYKGHNLVFELVSPTTHINKVHDRDIFYLINNRQVLWIFGLSSVVNYNELRRSVAKDILFTNRRNVFVFDTDAQNETISRGELMLKCNWLDENGEWYYNIEKNGKNGIFISLDQLTFMEDECRPFFYDADEPFFLKNPTKVRPAKLSREQLKKEILEAYEFEQARNRALYEMSNNGTGVGAFLSDDKWGFKYKDLVLIAPKFTSKPTIIGDFAKVEIGGKFGAVNRFGDVVLEPRYDYDSLKILGNGYILYEDSGNWRLFGIYEPLASHYPNDEVQIKTISATSSIYYLYIVRHLFMGQPAEEIYFIKDEIFMKDSASGKWRLWSTNGKQVTDVTWDSFELTSDDKIKVNIGGKTQMMSLDGEVIAEEKFQIILPLANGYSLVQNFDSTWNIIDQAENFVLPTSYRILEKINDYFVKYQCNNYWGILNYKGESIADARFKSIDAVNEDHFLVTIIHPRKAYENLQGKISLDGNKYYDVVGELPNGRKIIRSFKLLGLTDSNSNEILPPQYDQLCSWDDNRYRAMIDNKWGIIDENGVVLLPFEFSSISALKDNKATVKRGIEEYQIDGSLNKIEEETILLQSGFKKVKFGGKYGIFAPDGSQIVNFEYDEITTFRGRLVGIINNTLIKLNVFYPYRLAMRGSVLSDGLINVHGVKFKLLTVTKGTRKTGNVEIVLINWVKSIKNPIVLLYDKTKATKQSKHIDKDSDFTIGDIFSVTVSRVIRGYGNQKSKIKGVDITLEDGRISHIYKSDFASAKIDINSISIKDKFRVTKFGYNDELDRTIWKVERI